MIEVVVIARSGVILEEEKIVETIRKLDADSSTVLDFVENFRKIYPEEWIELVERFGLFGSKRRHTVATHFSNRLDVYSQKPSSLLVSFTRYREGGFKTTEKRLMERRECLGVHG